LAREVEPRGRRGRARKHDRSRNDGVCGKLSGEKTEQEHDGGAPAPDRGGVHIGIVRPDWPRSLLPVRLRSRAGRRRWARTRMTREFRQRGQQISETEVAAGWSAPSIGARLRAQVMGWVEMVTRGGTIENKHRHK
jgi:hypothetical protein